MEVEPIVLLGALVVNALAVGWSIRETFVLNGQTKELQKSSAKLRSEVERLSVHLNQEIVRLNRLNELTRGLYLSSARLIFKHALSTSGDNEDAHNSSGATYTDDEIVNFFVTFEGSLIEMKAIAVVIGDSDLVSLIETTRTSMPPMDSKSEKDEFYKKVHEFGNHATALHVKAYTLLQEVTGSANDE